MGARFCVVIGKDEVERREAQVKDLEEHTQESVPFSEVATRVAAKLPSLGVQTDGEHES
jgi:histidyl-tRNA synthetase